MIQMRIHNETDLYDPYDPSQYRINENAYRYLKAFFSEAESKKHIFDTLQIISDKPIDAERAEEALKDAVRKDQNELDRQIEANHRRAVKGYIIGIALSIAGCLLSVLLDQVLLELISFIGTMAIKDAFVIQRRLNPDLRHLKTRMDPFHTLKVEVVTEGISDCI